MAGSAESNATPEGALQDMSESLRAAISRFVRATRAGSDSIPRARAEILGQLERGGPQPIAALAEQRGVAHQSVSKAVGELERLGHVSRSPNPDDGRGFVIAISDKGREVLLNERNARRNLIARAVAGLPPLEQSLLACVPELLGHLSQRVLDESGND
jgi:DNA-binding MarR family transcriptional regulator